MSLLRSGDFVLDSPSSISPVAVNQHVHASSHSSLLHFYHSGGIISVTPEHVLIANGKPMPARAVNAGDALGEFLIQNITVSSGSIINPITSSGLILAAGASGKPVVAAMGNAWLADVPLSSYPAYSLSFSLALHFPKHVQLYYDAALEPFFSNAVPTRAAVKKRVPTHVAMMGVVLSDLILAVGLVFFSVTQHFSAYLAMAALLAFAGQQLISKNQKNPKLEVA